MKLMNHRYLSLLALVFVIGCGGGSKLVGAWKTDMQGQPATVNFNKDGTMTMVADIGQQPQGTFHAEVSGKWREEGNSVYSTMTGVKVTNASGQFAGKEAPIEKMITPTLEIGKEKKNTLVWDGDNKFTKSDENGVKQTYTRG